MTLRWSALLDTNRLTGEHFHWHERERVRLRRIAAQGASTDWRNERAADKIGILPSVTVSEARFKDLSGEYYRLWIRNGDGHEVFVAWLEELKRQVSAVSAAVWSGKSRAIDRWYERACEPVVEKTLAALVKDGINRVRAAEIKRLEAVARTKGDSRQAGFPMTNQAGVIEPNADIPTEGRKRGRPQFRNAPASAHSGPEREQRSAEGLEIDLRSACADGRSLLVL